MLTRHPDDGRLRRFSDEHSSFGAVETTHIATCARCRRRLARIEGVRDDVARAFVAPIMTGLHVQDIEDALARVHSKVSRNDAVLAPDELLRGRSPITMTRKKKETIMSHNPAVARSAVRPRAIAAAASVAALAAALMLTPIGTLAQSFITIFEPQQVAPLAVTTTDLHGLPDLRRYGTLVQPAGANAFHVANARAAAKAAGISVLTPSILPPGAPTTARYEVLPLTSASFTFSAAKAAASAAVLHKALPPMPAGLDGAELHADAGPAVVAVYGDTTNIAALLGAVVVVQAKVPVATSSGATVVQIEDYLLAQPGVSPSLASSIRAIGNPQTTLPIPIPIDLATAQPIVVQGVQGVSVGDNTGLGAAVIWQKGGVVYGVAGTATTAQLVAVANSLH